MDTKSRLNLFFKTEKKNIKRDDKKIKSNIVEIIEKNVTVHPLKKKLSFSNYYNQSFAISFENDIQVKDILFLDVESRDLGYAPSNTPYLIGLGYFTENSFTTKQIFLKNPIEEEKSLELLDELWQTFKYIVTYNGKSFDVPLIKSRYDYFLKTYPNHFIEHFDLYHIIRKISSFDRYRLIDSEKNILNLIRNHDLPGSYSGQAYHEFLVWNKPELVNQIIEHNETDIISLASLFIEINKEFILAKQNKKITWANKIYKADVTFFQRKNIHQQKEHSFILSFFYNNHPIDSEDYYYIGKIYKKNKKYLCAYKYFYLSYKFKEKTLKANKYDIKFAKKSLIESITILYFYLKKYKKALLLIDKYLPIEEADIQEKLLIKKIIIEKKIKKYRQKKKH